MIANALGLVRPVEKSRLFPKSRHHKLMSIGPHGQHRAWSSPHYTFGNAAHNHMGQAGSSVRGEYDQVDVVLAGVSNYLDFRRSLNNGVNHRSTR
jgi:hypothetical protein